MDIRKQFAHNLRKYMEEKGVRQQDFIDNLGYSSATVSQWVNGKAFPKPARVETLARYLGIPVDALYAGSDPDYLVQMDALRAENADLKTLVKRLTQDLAKLKPVSISDEDCIKDVVGTLKQLEVKEVTLKF